LAIKLGDIELEMPSGEKAKWVVDSPDLSKETWPVAPPIGNLRLGTTPACGVGCEVPEFST